MREAATVKSALSLAEHIPGPMQRTDPPERIVLTASDYDSCPAKAKYVAIEWRPAHAKEPHVVSAGHEAVDEVAN